MTLKEELQKVEKTIILTSYGENCRNQSATARALGISRTALIYKLKNYGALTKE